MEIAQVRQLRDRQTSFARKCGIAATLAAKSHHHGAIPLSTTPPLCHTRRRMSLATPLARICGTCLRPRRSALAIDALARVTFVNFAAHERTA
jgi:hypothetical protein